MQLARSPGEEVHKYIFLLFFSIYELSSWKNYTKTCRGPTSRGTNVSLNYIYNDINSFYFIGDVEYLFYVFNENLSGSFCWSNRAAPTKQTEIFSTTLLGCEFYKYYTTKIYILRSLFIYKAKTFKNFTKILTKSETSLFSSIYFFFNSDIYVLI